MTTKDQNGNSGLATTGNRVRLRLIKCDDPVEPQQSSIAQERQTATLPTKSKSPLVQFMASYAEAIERQVEELTSGLV